ncbi:hypothetical protein J4209_02500 [Candidatus Woesearchaeota archaeon]|nr:hypothetical protein [Candidatus Woesearchaeota archaeon]
MPHIIKELPEIKVKYKDVFHLKNLYVMMHEYLVEENFLDEDQNQTYNGHRFIETLYLENFCQKGLHAGGKEMWIYWRAIKRPEGKLSGYYRYLLDIDFHGVYIRDQEVIHQGKKMKVQFGELEIFFRPKIEADYRNEWEKHWLLKHFMKLYDTRVLSQEFEKREKELWRDVYKLQGKIKRFLNMRTFIPVPEPFWHPIYGYES